MESELVDLFVYLRFLNDSSSSSGFIASDDKTINEKWSEKDKEGGDHGLL
jgi:hypothetical protein